MVVALLVFLMRDDSATSTEGGKRELLVYCAAGVKKAVEEIAGKFEQELGVNVVLEYASSGVLAATAASATVSCSCSVSPSGAASSAVVTGAEASAFRAAAHSARLCWRCFV